MTLVSDNGEATAVQVKKKKPVKERLAEKAEQRRKEQEERKKLVLFVVLCFVHFGIYRRFWYR